MPSLWFVLIGIGSSLVLLLTGCRPTSASASGGALREETYWANPLSIPANVAPTLNVINEIGGRIIIIASHEPEVAVDAIVLGVGGSPEEARSEADNHVKIIQDSLGIRVVSSVDADGQPMNLQNSVLLHVRVPPNTNFPDVSTKVGDIDIVGDVGNVTAVITTSGNITVRGADGDVDLRTGQGAISADVMHSRKVTARANGGKIDLMAVDAAVSASTTQGDIRFVGTLQLGFPHTFSTTQAGNIDIAIPAYIQGQAENLLLRVYASTSASPINVDFPSRRRNNDNFLPICGLIHSARPYSYAVENTTAHFGRIEVSPAPTATYFFSGTLAAAYYFFETTQPRVTIYAPVASNVHIYRDSDLQQMTPDKIDPSCREALSRPSGLPALDLKVSTGQGRIFIHHIDLPSR